MVLVRVSHLNRRLEVSVVYLSLQTGPTSSTLACRSPMTGCFLLLRHSDHPVHEVEALPVLVSIVLWLKFIEGTQILH